MSFTLLLTCVGGHFVHDVVRALRDAEDFEVKLVGVDAKADVDGRHLVDHFETVPIPDSDGTRYTARLLEIAADYGVQAIIPGSDQESRAIATHQDAFTATGIRTSVSDHRVVRLMTDKLAMLEFLSDKGIDVGPFAEVDTTRDLRAAAETLGYPDRKVVIKPRSGSGSRGVLIADCSVPEFQYLLTDRFCGTGSLDAIVDEIEARQASCSDCLAMPYYGPQTYDVDCLSVKGQSVAVVPRLRLYRNPLSPVNEGCRIAMEPRILRYVQGLCRAFEVHGACDYDLALDRNGDPKLLDASCRLSGSVGASLAAGVNFPAQLVRILFDMPLRDYSIDDGAVLRPFAHMVKCSSQAKEMVT